MIRQSWRPTVALAVLLLLPGATAVAQSVLPKSSELVAFMGRWVFTTTNPKAPSRLSGFGTRVEASPQVCRSGNSRPTTC